MGSKSSKSKRLATPKTKAVTIPVIPQDIIDEILDHLATDSDIESLRTYALVSKSWVPSCRRHIFHTADFTSNNVHRWFKTFPAPEESPAHYVRELRVWIGGDSRVPEKFFEYIRWFTGVDRLCLLGHGGPPPSLGPSFWRLPQSTTSLSIDTDVVPLIQLRDIVAQLPNLDDLSLTGSLVVMDGSGLPEIGAVLRGRFGGKLPPYREYIDNDVNNMLSEIPSGLRFTEVWTFCTRDRLPRAIRLAEACGDNIVRLSHTDTLHRTFDRHSHGPTDSSGQNINANTTSRCRWHRDSRALLRLLQVPKSPRSAL